MVELEVEAVEAIDAKEDVDAPEYVLYGGKGGVGKTTMAAATALASALRSTSTLLVSTDPAHSLADTFEVEIGPEVTKLLEEAPLYAVEIDPEQPQVGESVLGSEGFEGIFGGANGPIEQFLGEGAIPGADEAVALQQLLLAMEDDRFERVVVDTAPTGHTLRLLELPELLDSMLGRLLKVRERFEGMFDGMPSPFGAEESSTPQPGIDELRARIETLRTVLRDPRRTDFRVVVVPETLSVVESRRMIEQLADYGIEVETIVVNRVLEDPGAVTEAAAVEGLVAPDPSTCPFCEQRWAVQQEALADATDLFQGRTVKRVPLLSVPVTSLEILQVIATCLD